MLNADSEESLLPGSPNLAVAEAVELSISYQQCLPRPRMASFTRDPWINRRSEGRVRESDSEQREGPRCVSIHLTTADLSVATYLSSNLG